VVNRNDQTLVGAEIMNQDDEMLTAMKNAQTGIWWAQHKLAALEPSEKRTEYALALETVAIHLADVLNNDHGVMQ
jgi:hypothetical protein